MLDLGLVSKATAASELGRDWNDEQERIAKEAQANPGAAALDAYASRPRGMTRREMMGMAGE